MRGFSLGPRSRRGPPTVSRTYAPLAARRPPPSPHAMLPSLLLTIVPLLLPSSPTPGDAPSDWPQWRGPARDGVSPATGLEAEWPVEGPPVHWRATGLGGGYGAPAVQGDVVYGAGYRGEDEVVWAIDAATGKERWSTRVAPAFREIEYGEGPRATPTIDHGELFTLGAAGNLVALEAETGALLWSVDLPGTLGGEMMSGWGYSESPLVDGELVVCTPGGAKGTVAALDRHRGTLVWQSSGLTDPAAYSSLLAVEWGGHRQYVVLTGLSVAGLAAADGKLLWRTERVGKTAVVPTPIFHDGRVWVTSGYGTGCSMYELREKDGALSVETAYANRVIKNDQGGAVRIGDYVYASSGVLLVCMNWRTGELVWRERSLSRASVTYADGHLYVRGEQGELALVEANPEKYVEKARFTQGDRSAFMSWPPPVIAGGKLYLRDQDVLLCYDVARVE